MSSSLIWNVPVNLRNDRRQTGQDFIAKNPRRGEGSQGLALQLAFLSYLVKLAASNPVRRERLRLTVGHHNKLMMCVSFFKIQTHIMCDVRICPVTISRLTELKDFFRQFLNNRCLHLFKLDGFWSPASRLVFGTFP